MPNDLTRTGPQETKGPWADGPFLPQGGTTLIVARSSQKNVALEQLRTNNFVLANTAGNRRRLQQYRENVWVRNAGWRGHAKRLGVTRQSVVDRIERSAFDQA